MDLVRPIHHTGGRFTKANAARRSKKIQKTSGKEKLLCIENNGCC